MSDFEIIPDADRPVAGPGPIASPRNLALRDGKTLFIPTNGKAPSVVQAGPRNYLKSHGMILRYRQTEREGVQGIIAWAEPKDATR